MNTDKIALWKKWNEEGFFPGPDETEEEFQKRVEYCQHLLPALESETDAFPFNLRDGQSQQILEESFSLTEPLYGITPRWVLLFFNNTQLSLWHGGCAWIFQLHEHTPTAAFLQLRKSFRESPCYLGMYHRSELIAHEMAHIGRMMYQEPQFEEFLAYQSSTGFRRWFGPIVQSSKETLFFILLLGLAVFADLALLLSDSPASGTVNTLSWWIKILPIGCVIFALGRLFYRHAILRKCLKNLEQLFLPSDAKHLLYRLRDTEIKQFSRLSGLQIRDFIAASASHSFRWKFLDALYGTNR